MRKITAEQRLSKIVSKVSFSAAKKKMEKLLVNMRFIFCFYRSYLLRITGKYGMYLSVCVSNVKSKIVFIFFNIGSTMTLIKILMTPPQA